MARLAAILAFALFSGVLCAQAQTVTPEGARAIAKDATIYGFPMVDNYRILSSYFIDKGGSEYKAPWNTLVNNARVYTPDDTAIQTPNSDTPYSYVGADLRAEPLVFTVPAIDWMKPLWTEQERRSPEFFSELNFLFQFAPVAPSERALRARFAELGIGGGEPFNLRALSPELRKALEEGMTDGWAAFKTHKESELDTGKETSADAFGTRAFLHNDYMARMSGAVLGIYGNSKQEAIYPVYFVGGDGKPLTGANAYTLRFAPGQLPPVNAFWSFTMYELPKSLLYANTLNRYLINSPMLPNLKKDADGGLTLYASHDSPGADKESNWLPAPDGPFFAALRLYWPKPQALDGRWKAPKLTQVASPAAVIPVNADNFVRAESDLYFSGVAKDYGLGKISHTRTPAPIDNQTVIRLNRDTLYSAGVFDLDAGPVTITLPEAHGRFMSMQVIDEDQYTAGVFYGAGPHTFTRQGVGTRYLVAAFRTLVDPSDPKDLEAVHALQDAIKVEQPGGPGAFEIPHWDMVSQKATRDALLALAAQLPDTKGMFGPRGHVDPVRRLIGAASAWGGNPEKDALYLNVTPAKNDGKTVYKLDVKDVPVDGFWSISVYNSEGYFEPNPQNAYTLNNITAKKSPDGSVAVQFGACEGDVPNCLPTAPGWNYLVRLYRPRPQVLNGEWKFPEPRPAN